MFRKSGKETKREELVRDILRAETREYHAELEDYKEKVATLEELARRTIDFTALSENTSIEDEQIIDDTRALDKILTDVGFIRKEHYLDRPSYVLFEGDKTEHIYDRNRETGEEGLHLYEYDSSKTKEKRLSILRALIVGTSTFGISAAIGSTIVASMEFYLAFGAFAAGFPAFYTMVSEWNEPKGPYTLIEDSTQEILGEIKDMVSIPEKPSRLVRVEAGEDIDDVGKDVFEPDYNKIPNPKKRKQ